MVEFDLGYNAEVSVVTNSRGETSIKIEDNGTLSERLITTIVETISLVPLMKNLSKQEILDIIKNHNDLYEDSEEDKITKEDI